MRSINPFDELGRILSRGGEAGSIAKLAGGTPIPVVLAYIGERYPRLPSDQRQQLLDLAMQAVESGRMPGVDIVDAELAFQAAPINPVVGGYDERGVRYKVTALASFFDESTGESKTIRTAIELATAMTDEQIREEILRQVEIWERDSPRLRKKLNEVAESVLTVSIESRQKRY